MNLGGGTYRMQGYVTFSHTVNDMTVNCYLLAQMTGSNAYGYTWTYYSEEGTALPASGNYTFTGRCESLLLSPFKLSLNTVGSFEITHSNALSIGINLEIVSAAYSVGMTTYYRQDVTVTHVETLSHKS